MKSAYVRTAVLITIAATAVLAISLSRLSQVYRLKRSFEALKDSTAPNVVLITVDSLRPDHLGCYGYPKEVSPHIDRIAREGTLFTLAFSQASWTSPSLVSLFTAFYPSVHGVDARGKSVSPSLPTLPKTLKRAGFSVPGLTYIVDDPNYHHLGFEQVPHEQKDLATWIGEYGSRPFFIFVHIHTAHLPYNPEPPLDTAFLPPTITSDFLAENSAIRFVRSNVLVRPEDIQFKGTEKTAVIAQYDGEVYTADGEVGKVVEILRAHDLLDRTLMIVTADHGEELFERGFIGHASTNLGGTLYEELIRVPLIVGYPPPHSQGRRDSRTG
jgi:arylsulfatase A-like enzyme